MKSERSQRKQKEERPLKDCGIFSSCLERETASETTKTTIGTYWQTLVKELQENLIFPVISHDLECYNFCMSDSIVVYRSASDAIPALDSAQKGADREMLEKRSDLSMFSLLKTLGSNQR